MYREPVVTAISYSDQYKTVCSGKSDCVLRLPVTEAMALLWYVFLNYGAVKRSVEALLIIWDSNITLFL